VEVSPSSASTGPTANTKLAIEYPREKIPSFENPPSRGQRYKDRVPDTLDIAERAELAVHVMTSVADPKADYEIYGWAWWFRNPPVMNHDHSDWVQSVEGLMEALPLLRMATGSELNRQVDLAWMQVNLKSIGPDGLVYEPLNGIPWSRMNPGNFEPVWRANGTATTASDASVAFATTPAKCSRIIGAMTVYYLRDKNPVWTRAIERMIGRLSDLTVDRGDFAYIPLGSVEPDARFGPQAKMPTGTEAVEHGNIRLIQGLEQYYKVTGYEPARALAAKLVRYAMGPAESYDPQGRLLFDPLDKEGMRKRFPGIENEKFGGHTHSRTLGLLCILEHATAVKDQEAMGFVKSGYEWVKTQGSSLVGFFPEHIIPGFAFPSCEGCSVGDMVALALKLSVAGVGDYWDDADRWVRNMLAEQQLVEGDWLDRMAASMPKKPLAFNQTEKLVTESNIGGFGGSTTGNEWGDIIEHCCTGNCVRALYYVWEHMLEAKGEELWLNLLLNRASSWAEVYSYIPYEGRVDLIMKKFFGSVLVRAPEWVQTGSPAVVCNVNGVPRNGRWRGRYLNFGRGLPGDKMVVKFPIEERTVKETIGGLPYTLIIKGNTVVAIDPPGRYGPLYQRAHYRENQARWREVNRFVPQESIVW
jgi:hypothetical protein